MMNQTFIWGHRGAGFRAVMNTIPSFILAQSMGVDGLKSEAKLSKEGKIVLTFHNILDINGKGTRISELTVSQIKEYNLENNLKIPTLEELFLHFKGSDIRYNFDITDPSIGIQIIKKAKEFDLLENIELGKPAIYKGRLYDIFSEIRDFNTEVNLSNTISLLNFPIERKDLEIKAMNELDVNTVNVNYGYSNYNLFKRVKDLGFKFYVWGLIFKRSMKKFLKMKYKNNYIDGMFSNFPDRLLELRDEIQNRKFN
ncbi:MAG: Glycerophosphoryl diester phosphodiesterase family protein [Promethearchaeota archaeon]|nr:MAG: Glycerophosphoryl diester phosphodiesterase family protein [Candidatus Lokiarchaeota archaeon]